MNACSLLIEILALPALSVSENDIRLAIASAAYDLRTNESATLHVEHEATRKGLLKLINDRNDVRALAVDEFLTIRKRR